MSTLCGLFLAGGVVWSAPADKFGLTPVQEAGAVVVVLWAMVRFYFARVECTVDSVTVYGYFWSRTIPKASIATYDVSSATIRWTTPTGGIRRTVAWVLWPGGSQFAAVNRHTWRCAEAFRDWAGVPQFRRRPRH